MHHLIEIRRWTAQINTSTRKLRNQRPFPLTGPCIHQLVSFCRGSDWDRAQTSWVIHQRARVRGRQSLVRPIRPDNTHRPQLQTLLHSTLTEPQCWFCDSTFILVSSERHGEVGRCFAQRPEMDARTGSALNRKYLVVIFLSLQTTTKAFPRADPDKLAFF